MPGLFAILMQRRRPLWHSVRAVAKTAHNLVVCLQQSGTYAPPRMTAFVKHLLIHDERHLHATQHDIHQNPVTAGLVDEAECFEARSAALLVTAGI